MSIPILSVRDENGDFVPINAIKGDKGDTGKSTYQTWLDLGNTGTEADFIASLHGEDGADGEDGTFPELSSLNEKTTLADNDAMLVADSAASGAHKKTLWSTIKALLLLKSDYVTTGGTGKVLASVDSDKLGGVAASGYAKEINGQSELSAMQTSDNDEIPIYAAQYSAQKKIKRSTLVKAFDAVYTKHPLTQTIFTAIDDADYIAILDVSEPDDRQKRTLWSNIKSVLKTYFDGLYAPKISVVPSTSTTPTIATAATGTIYTFSNALTSLAITTNPAGSFWYRIDFTAGGTFTPTYAATPTWNGGTAPTITSGKKYSLIITDHISSFAEA